ncbi:MAG TPA: hypothetical protein VD932_05005, partial [Aquabacterium sp.]|nr:hypothetical protein [Aquabacterium sp.]
GARPWWQRAAWAQQALAIQRYLGSGRIELLETLTPALAADVTLLRAALVECRVTMSPGTAQHHFADFAHYVSAHLPAAAAAQFWRELGSGCEQRLSPSDQRSLRLHRAVAAGDPRGIAQTAKTVLDEEPQLKERMLAHALAAYMAGQIMRGEGPEALRAFAQHRARLGAASGDWMPVFRFLLGQADYRAAQPRPGAAKIGQRQ